MSLRYSLPAPMMRTRPSSKKNRTAAEVGKNKAAPDENPEESRVAAPPLSRPPKEMTPSAPLLFSAAHANEKHEEDGDFYSHGLRSLALHHHHPSDLPSGNDEKDRSSPFPPLLQSSNARVDDADDDDDALTIHYHPTLLSHRSHKSGRGLRKRKKSRRLASPRNNVFGSHMLPDIPEIDEGMSSDSTPPVTNVTEASVTPTHPCVPPPPLPSSPLQKSVASSPLPSSPIVAVHRRNGPLHSPTTILPGTNVPAQNDRNDDPLRFRLMELADDSLLDQSIPSAEVLFHSAASSFQSKARPKQTSSGSSSSPPPKRQSSFFSDSLCGGCAPLSDFTQNDDGNNNDDNDSFSSAFSFLTEPSATPSASLSQAFQELDSAEDDHDFLPATCHIMSWFGVTDDACRS